MKVIDPGHSYQLTCLDGGGTEPLKFVKRNDPPEKYPGNKSAYPGTTIQEVCRALVDRLRYVNAQSVVVTGQPCREDINAIHLLQGVIWLLETRAARLHGRRLKARPAGIELVPTCPTCGHIECTESGHQAATGGHTDADARTTTLRS